MDMMIFFQNKRKSGYVFFKALLILGILALTLFWIKRVAHAQQDPVQVLYFYSEECEQCEFVEEFILGPLKEIYPLEIIRVNVDEKQGYERLLIMEEVTENNANEIPVIFIGSKAMGGVEEIETSLENTLINVLEETAAATDTFPAEPVKKGKTPRPKPEPKPKASPVPDAFHEKTPPHSEQIQQESTLLFKVYAAFFSKHGCTECNRAFRDIKYLQSKYPNFIVRIYDIEEDESKVLNEALGQICAVPEKKRLTAPSIFIGKDFLLEDEIRVSSIEALILKYSMQQEVPPWEMARDTKKRASQTIVNRFKGLNISTIIAAGLLDGINPCAFATIIFFISYLAYIGRKGKEILFVGAAFTIAVFITYILIGLGFLSFIKTLSFLPLISKIVYIATAIFALILGIFSLRDYFRCRKGHIGDMSLQLPDFLKKHIHKTIRKEANVKRYVIGALITGFVISVLELACTGQVYLPTIIFVNRISTLKLRAMFYLVLYNLMFISPLVAIFLTVYKGTSSQQLTALFQRSSATIKLGMALLFFTLAGVLFVTMI